MSGTHDDTLLAASQAINTRPCGKDAQRSEHTGQRKSVSLTNNQQGMHLEAAQQSGFLFFGPSA
ncbi:hypothetical protein BZG05_10630 [Salinivibrio kushneri]|nr:hypothetical protein BZG05_10630 [Salinivibrio kushneri]